MEALILSLTSYFVRFYISRKDRKRDRGLATPENIERFDNIQYGEDDSFNLLDIYRPKQHECEKFPVIINFHGGAWVYSTKDTYQFYCMELAQMGFAVVNFSYRLAPESKFPANVEDCCNAVRWVQQNAGRYLLDLKNVFAVADSAGCHIAGLFLAACTDGEYAKGIGVEPPENFKINAIAFNCGCYRLLRHGEKSRHIAVRNLIKDLLPENGSEKEERYLNVTDHVNENFPPAYIMSCTDDFMLYQHELILEAYKMLGLPYFVKIYKDIDGKKLYHIFHVDIRNSNSRICNSEECDFFKKYMRK